MFHTVRKDESIVHPSPEWTSKISYLIYLQNNDFDKILINISPFGLCHLSKCGKQTNFF